MERCLPAVLIGGLCTFVLFGVCPAACGFPKKEIDEPTEITVDWFLLDGWWEYAYYTLSSTCVLPEGFGLRMAEENGNKTVLLSVATVSDTMVEFWYSEGREESYLIKMLVDRYALVAEYETYQEDEGRDCKLHTGMRRQYNLPEDERLEVQYQEKYWMEGSECDEPLQTVLPGEPFEQRVAYWQSMPCEFREEYFARKVSDTTGW